jgi:predicted RND superfamily exporter protein
MKQWKQGIESAVMGLARQILRHSVRFLWGFAVGIVLISQSLWWLEFDPELESFTDAESPERVLYKQVNELFGRSDVILLAIEGDVLSIDFIPQLINLHEILETELPYVESILSLVNAPHQSGQDNTLSVTDLIDTAPNTRQDLIALKQRIDSNLMAKNLLISDDHQVTLLVIEPARFNYDAVTADPFTDSNFDDSVFNDSVFEDTGLDNSDFALESDTTDTAVPYVSQANLLELLDELDRLLLQFEGLSASIAGVPPLNTAMERSMKDEMALFLMMTITLIIATLWLFFRHWSAVIAPLTAVISALLITLAFIVVFGQKIQIPLILLPSFLLAITIGDAVHLLTHFFNGYVSGVSKHKAMEYAIGRTALPMFVTSLTTSGGLLSMLIADVMPIRNLGLFSAIGVMIAFVLTVTLIPALIMVLPLSSPAKSRGHGMLDTLISKLSGIAAKYGSAIAVLWAIATIVALTQIVQLRFSHDPMNWMSEKIDIVASTQFIDKSLSGTLSVDIVIDTKEVDGIKNLALLNKVDKWQRALRTATPGDITISYVYSLVDALKETNRALHDELPSAYQLPDSQSLLVEELFLFESSAADQLYQWVDRDFQQLHVSLMVPWRDLMYYNDFLEEVQKQGTELFGDDANVLVSGMLALMANAMSQLITDTASSYSLAIIVIAVMMIWLLNSVRLGLLAMIPNIAPIIIVMGFMLPLGIKLDMLTMMVATLAIGIAVDNTVHFTHHFRTGIAQGHNSEHAMRDAFAGAGRALFTTSLVLSAGFYVFLFSGMRSAFNFGFLSGTAFLLAMVSNFTLTPYLLSLYYRTKS